MAIAIERGVAYLDGNKVLQRPSPNRNGRIEPQLIVIHETASHLTKFNAADYLCKPSAKVSAHFVIERDGTIVQLVPADCRAWHCDPSTWHGRGRINDISIGIELVGPGRLKPISDSQAISWFGTKFPITDLVKAAHPDLDNAGYWLPFTAAQEEANRMLCEALLVAFPSICDIRGHYEIAPKRKEDPNPCFSMDNIRHLLGNRRPMEEGIVRAAQIRLNDLGYDAGHADDTIGPKTRSAIRTFQEQNGLTIDGKLNDEVLAALHSPDAIEMTIGAREATTKEDLRAQGSVTISTASKIKRGSEIGAGWEVFTAVNQASSTVDKVVSAKTLGEQISAISAWAFTPNGIKTIVTLSILLLIWFGANKIEWRRVRDHIRGLARV